MEICLENGLTKSCFMLYEQNLAFDRFSAAAQVFPCVLYSKLEFTFRLMSRRDIVSANHCATK
jgi:hypothetical protein